VEKLEELVNALPKANRNILAALSIFLHKLNAKADVNKMDAVTLGTIFGPYLIRPTRSLAKTG
jgi:hypothetical protein